MCMFNCKGFNISIAFIKHLLKECDILLVHETWLLKDQVGRLNGHFIDYNKCGISGINKESLLKDRPYGGVSFLQWWRKESRPTAILSKKEQKREKMSKKSRKTVTFVPEIQYVCVVL